MRWMFLIAALVVSRLASAAPPTRTVTIEAVPVQTRVHRNDVVSVRLQTRNTTDHTQAFRIMTCSWQDEWRSDDPQLVPGGADCAKNFAFTLTLAPGAVDVRVLALHVDTGASLGAHAFRLGFTAIGRKDTVWSTPATVRIVAVGAGVRLSARYDLPDHIVFTVTNTNPQSIELADHLVLQRLVDGEWADMTWVSATGCAAPPVTCTVLAPGGSIASAPWLGMTCGQCICHASTPAEPGEYRLVARSCHGDVDYVEANQRATVTLVHVPR